jgi:hypothetical protein
VFAELLALMSESTIRKRRSTVLFEGTKFILGSPLGAESSARSQRQPDVCDMFRLIFRMLGVPSIDDLADMTRSSSGVLQVLLQQFANADGMYEQSDPNVHARLQRRLDAADDEELLLLRSMLSFHPQKRPSACALLSRAPLSRFVKPAAAASIAEICSSVLWPEISALTLEFLVEGAAPTEQFAQKLLHEIGAFSSSADAAAPRDQDADCRAPGADRVHIRRRKVLKANTPPVIPPTDSPGLTALVSANTKRMRQLRLDSMTKSPALLSPESPASIVTTPVVVPAKKARGGLTPAVMCKCVE